MTWSMSAALSIVMLGVWLQLSFFLWPHSLGQGLLAALGGFLFVVFGAFQIRRWRWAGIMNVTVAVWLGAGALILPQRTALSVFNHLLASVAVLAFVLLGQLPLGHSGGVRDRLDGT